MEKLLVQNQFAYVIDFVSEESQFNGPLILEKPGLFDNHENVTGLIQHITSLKQKCEHFAFHNTNTHTQMELQHDHHVWAFFNACTCTLK